MNGHNKRFSIGWTLGIALGVASGAALVHAVTLPHTFTAGDTISASQMNENFETLNNAIDGCPDGMARVGNGCIDTNAQLVTSIPPGCQPTGNGCTDIVAENADTAAGVPYSWGQAVAVCTNAGKRLATPTELLAGANTGAITVPENSFTFANAAVARGSSVALAGAHVFVATGGQFRLGGTNTDYTEQFPNSNANVTVALRCAR